ncbi:MAG: NosD domain-containing protein [Melioribacteraceae bacterium]
MKKTILYIFFLLQTFTFAAGPLNGNYTIDASGSGTTNFLTVADAVASLYSLGVSGPVTFDIVGTFNEQIDLNGAITGSSKFNPITFQNGEITYTAASTVDNYLVRIKSASFIEFIHIKFTAGGTNYSRIVYSETPSGVIKFNANEFLSNSTTGSSIDKAIVYCVANNTAENLNSFKFTNNTFDGGTYGLFLESYISTKSVGLLVSSNTFTTAFRAIHLDNFDAPKISSNIITNKSINDYAIYLTDCINDFEIEKNKISSTEASSSGIRILNCSVSSDRSLIVNNFIQACDKGIFITGSDDVDVFFNSINIEISTGTSLVSSAALAINSLCSDLKLMNNIFANKRNGYSFDGGASTGGQSNSPQVTTSDFNCFFTNGSTSARWNNTLLGTLGTFISYTGFDNNSTEIDPQFNSITDLHTNSPALLNTGITQASVTTDIDGDLRDLANPCIGADEYFGPLSGTYTIGITGDYTTITNAVNDLYSRGIDGAVIFKIANGTYTEQIDLDGEIGGSSSTNTITFESYSGDATDVEVKHTAMGIIDNFVVRINEVEHVKFKNLTLTALGTTYAKVVSLENVTGNLEFFGNVMNGFELSSFGSIEDQSVVYCNNSVKLDNTTFENNVINNGYNGIYLDLQNSSPKTINLLIKGNTISTYSNSILLNFVDAPKISSNTCVNVTGYGISLLHTDNDFIIEDNKIDGVLGIGVTICIGTALKRGVIKNNIVSSNNKGISIKGSKYISVYYNTVENNTSYSFGAAFKVDEIYSYLTDNIIVKNNIFSVLYLGYTVFWESGAITECNYNNLYTTGSILVRNGITNYATLLDWQNAPEGFDVNSYSEEVTFVSSTDLHIESAPQNLIGTNIASITEDIDGDTRGTPPFIGADEPQTIDVSLKVMLEGPYNSSAMNASLTLPTVSPYGDGKSVNSIPVVTSNEVVDWVMVELRDENDSSIILETQSAFILKDGTIVDTDGSSPLSFIEPNGNYFVSVKHRNHLGIMSGSAIFMN